VVQVDHRVCVAFTFCVGLGQHQSHAASHSNETIARVLFFLLDKAGTRLKSASTYKHTHTHTHAHNHRLQTMLCDKSKARNHTQNAYAHRHAHTHTHTHTYTHTHTNTYTHRITSHSQRALVAESRSKLVVSDTLIQQPFTGVFVHVCMCILLSCLDTEDARLRHKSVAQISGTFTPSTSY